MILIQLLILGLINFTSTELNPIHKNMEYVIKWIDDDIKDLSSCFAINFGYVEELPFPQLTVEIDDDRTWNTGTHGMNFANDCSFVVIAGNYLNMVDDVMKKVDQITEDINKMPTVTFVVHTNDDQEVSVNTLVRDNYSPPLVSCLLILEF